MGVSSNILYLANELTAYSAVVLYKPMLGEVAYDTPTLPMELPTLRFMIQPDAHTDPFAVALQCSEVCGGHKTFILIPGKHFDDSGTRHGHGGGWYDRFLTAIPQDWLRIGIANISQLSKTRHIRKSHDEPVDWIITFDGISFGALKCEARTKHKV